MPLSEGLATYTPVMRETEVHLTDAVRHERRAPRASAPMFKRKVRGAIDREIAEVYEGSSCRK
jgi:hypothetical protein